MPITQYNSSVRQMSQSKFNSMKNSSGKIPDLANQIVMTNSEDSNISCLRTEVVYDMTSSDASKNWGYPNGIGTGVTINKDFSKYNFLVCEYLSYNNSIIGFCDLSQPTMPSDTTGRYMIYAVAYIGNAYSELISVIDLNKSSLTTYLPGSGNLAVKIAKIYGILKTPSMIYTGDELIAGNGINIENGVISADNDANFVIYNLFNDAEKSVTSGAEIIYSVGKQLKKGKYYACVYGQVFMNTRMGFLQLTIDSQTNVVEAATNSVSRIGIYGSNIVTLDNDGEHAIYLKLTAQANSTITLQGYSTYGFAIFRIGD